MNRRMVTEHHPLPAGSARRGPRGGARLETGARTGWRPDIAVLVAVLGLLLGVLVMIPLINAVAPGPPSVFTVQPPTPPQPVLRARPTHSPSATTYRSGTSVVSHGVAYSALSAVRTSSLALPGNAASLQGNLVIVKVLLRGVATTPSTASIGLVDLVDGGTAYRPLLAAASALSHTRWQALLLHQVSPGETKRAKLVYQVPNAVPTRLTLLIGSHTPGAPRFAIPIGAAT